LIGLAGVWACESDSQLREYLSAHFWLPFAKHAASFERPHVRRMDAPYAGMTAVKGESPLEKLREAYQQIPRSTSAVLRQAVAAARAAASTTRDKEEVDLIEAKIEMRVAEPDDDELLQSAENKLQVFLRRARTPEFRSEARGWLAHIYYISGDQTAAGKIYLDELNRSGSNLSRETLLNSLRMNYGYDGGPELLDHLEEYFDTPAHAAFAIQLATNPHWHRDSGRFERPDNSTEAYARIKALLAKHEKLLQSNQGSGALALLAMRTALRIGDPPSARKIAESVPADAAIRTNPDFYWMSGSALFLSREYAAAETPLRSLFRSRLAGNRQKAAAAYALCGVYWKTHNVSERLRFALWLRQAARGECDYLPIPAGVADLSIYWASSGWDLNMILEAEAPLEALQSFIQENPDEPEIRLVKYAAAVRLSRANRYEEAAEIYRSIDARRRAPRTERLAVLYREANREGLSAEARGEARYKLAEFIAANPDRIYFNDRLWGGFQRYAMQSPTESRMTRDEREALIAGERKLKDEQEERWQAYLILRGVVQESGRTDLGRKAVLLAVRCLRGINERFERQEEIRQADIELSGWLRRSAP
jgi:hypothetical protein